MKLVNEKGKLFGIINLIDLILLLCIAVVAIAIVYKSVIVADSASNAGEEISEMTVELRVRGAMDYLEEEITKVKEGTKLVAGTEFVEGAEVVSVESVPYETSTTNDNGEFIYTVDNSRYDLLITIKAPQDKNAPVYKIATQEVRVGRGFVFKTQEFEVNTIVETVEFNG